MATALHRIESLTSELEQLKGVVMRHAGMDSSNGSSKSGDKQKDRSRSKDFTRQRSEGSQLSSKSRDAASAGRKRSESKGAF